MLLSKLMCSSCGYKSDAFGDTRDIHDQCYTFVFQNRSTNEITISEVTASELVRMSIDLDALDATTKLREKLSTPLRRFLEIPVGQSGIAVDAVCPSCGVSVLTKEIIGLQ